MNPSCTGRRSCTDQNDRTGAGDHVNAAKVHVLGSRHSFNNIADSLELISLEDLHAAVIVDHEAQTVSLSGGVKYGDLVKTLNERKGSPCTTWPRFPTSRLCWCYSDGDPWLRAWGVAGDNAVAGLEMVLSSGEICTVFRGEPDFDGLVVGLGALGAVTRITLDVQPAYEVKQRVFAGLSWKALYDHFDEITSCGYSVSIFTRWGETNDQVWVKSRMDEPDRVEGDLFSAVAATVDLNPIVDGDATSCTPQLGRPDLWSERLPHFRIGSIPSSGQEIQSEYLVPRRHGLGAKEAVRALADEIQPILQVSEIRRVAADRLWMSMNYEQDLGGHPLHLEARARGSPEDGHPDRGCLDPV